MTILVDSSVWISYLNGVSSAEAAYLAVCIGEDRPLAVPGLVQTEVLMGVRSEAEAARVSRSLAAFPLTPDPAPSDYQRAAAICRECRTRGFTIRSMVDCLIAQLCLRDGHELLAQGRDFDAIDSVFPLRRVSIRLMVHDSAISYLANVAASAEA
ncbi:MAG: type II toxin-antitoxin system VapC family toxin [Steroidobacteraceae bacterium]